MGKKRPNINGKNVIGFDETYLFELMGDFVRNYSMLVTGYYWENYPGSHPTNEQYEAKGGIFTLKKSKSYRSDEEVKIRATGYLRKHPNFLYSRIKREDLQTRNPLIARAEAVTAITLRFFEEFNLSEKNTFVCSDMLVPKRATEEFNFLLKDFFRFSNLFKENYGEHVYFQGHADLYNRACKTADRVGYHILALKFRANKGKWPCRNRIIHKEDYLELMVKRRF